MTSVLLFRLFSSSELRINRDKRRTGTTHGWNQDTGQQSARKVERYHCISLCQLCVTFVFVICWVLV